MKKEFICVKPKSEIAKDFFVNEMHQLHSCRVMKRERNKVFLSSISGRYDFEMFEGIDDNWEVVK